MAAFGRVESGIPGMDAALDNIRLGDNVVWRVTDLDDFKKLLIPYVDQAIHDKRNLIYIRFASHEPLLTEREGLKIKKIELNHRFENFTVEIHNLIEREGKDSFYVFDCLSELQTAWSTDLMMGNFFRLTCPFLFQLDTVAYFPIIRGKHSFDAIAKIRDTTQLFLDVYPDGEDVYVKPLKVWNRYSESMFMTYHYNAERNEYSLVSNSVEVSRFYEVMNKSQDDGIIQNMDSWERFFSDAEQRFHAGEDISKECGRMCDIMMSRDERIRRLIKENFEPRDYFEVRKKMIGTGMIGGKACGMLLARKLVGNKAPRVFEHLEPHDSFYIGSDVFYSYIVDNQIWDIRIRQRREEEYFSLAETFADCLKNGVFSRVLEEEFMRLLDYYGQSPIIVRSSSILEDGFGNAFAGKYESVFCSNTGTPEERLAEFEAAVKIVYASTMSKGALDYRMRRNLGGRDEQMSLLVQRVSGSKYEEYFMPCAAGVGYSYSPYRIREDIDPSKGMLRLVMGLGTGAVDRVEGSYPRLVNLDAPEKLWDDKSTVRQRKIDVINLKSRDLEKIELSDILDILPFYLRSYLIEHDYELEHMFRERGQNREFYHITCRGIVKNEELMNDMRDMLAAVSTEYEYPVDMEYTINLSENGEYMINLLQCRPLQVSDGGTDVTVPDNAPEEEIFLECRGASMGLSKKEKIDYIICVDPVAYYNMNYKDKYYVSEAIGKINWHFRNSGKHMLLLVPGRICTSSPELGVAGSFSDISEFSTICEVSESKAGYIPELSYGSHIFQDMVENEILYAAVFENDHTLHYRPEFLKEIKNEIGAYTDRSQELETIAGIYNVSDKNVVLYHDMKSEHLLCIWK